MALQYCVHVAYVALYSVLWTKSLAQREAGVLLRVAGSVCNWHVFST